jgi:hypothetical protein
MFKFIVQGLRDMFNSFSPRKRKTFTRPKISVPTFSSTQEALNSDAAKIKGDMKKVFKGINSE